LEEAVETDVFHSHFSDKQIKTASKSHFDKISDRKSNTLVAEPVEASQPKQQELQ